jgi:hypothetical protein
MNVVLFCGGLGVRIGRRGSGFRSYWEAFLNDFVQSTGGRDVELVGPDIADGRITVIEVGALATGGVNGRLPPVQHLAAPRAWSV